MPSRPRHCQLCKQEIPQARLEAIPETRICVDCSKKIGGEFQLELVPENLSKQGSLKKNYGSFDVKKSRRKL
jgi:hypothetical protein